MEENGSSDSNTKGVMMETSNLNIYQRVNEIKKEIGYIQKDKKVESYMAVTHDAVTEHTRDLFTKHGVLIIPHELSSVTVLSGTTTAKGVPYVRFEGKYQFDFVNIDTPSEKFSVEYSAHALDHGDKAPGKAHSYSMKYAILKALQIASGEEEEGRAEQKAEKPRSDANKSVGASDFDKLHPDRQTALVDLSMEIIDAFKVDGEQTAYDWYREASDNLGLIEEQTALRSRLPSHIKTAFTKIFNSRKEAANG